MIGGFTNASKNNAKMKPNTILQGDVLEKLKELPDESVDCIITSPPYWGLRDYGESTCKVWDGDETCEHLWLDNNFCARCRAWKGQLGLEPTLDLYLKHMLQITAELKRVLKKTGVMFWNHDTNKIKLCDTMQNYRLIIKMLDEQGWLMPQKGPIIWSKPNHMPDSFKRGFTHSYEPIFMLVKNKKYYFDLDAVRVPHKESSVKRWESEVKSGRLENPKLNKQTKCSLGVGTVSRKGRSNLAQQPHFLGKNPGDVWIIPTQPFPEAHFACADMFTEILTKNGWKKWDEVTLNDEIATFDILDETIHYHKPYAIYRYEYKGELVVIENQWVAQYVTLNHRVLLKYVHSAIHKKPDDFWHYEQADSLRPYSGILIPLSGKYEGDLDVGSVERAELLGWILSEGCLSGLKKGKGITIYQSNDANPDKVKRIEELLQKCRIDYTRIDRKGQRTIIRDKEYVRHEVCFYIKKRGQNWQWILDWINDDKTPKWRLLHIKYGQLKALYRGIIAGDGHHRKDGRDSFTQKNEYIREWFRTLCIHLGKRTTEFNKPRLRSAGTVFVTNKNYAQIHESDFKECIKRVNYGGIVWCPYLPNTNFVARRKGCDGKWRYFITGNTFPERLVEPMIKAGCPQWICKKCGKARERIIDKNYIPTRPGLNTGKGKSGTDLDPNKSLHQRDISKYRMKIEYYTIGWTDCGCNAGWRPGIVLDPFFGSGTTGLVALKLGRNFIGIELNPDYIKIAKKRLEKWLKQTRLEI